MYGNAQKSADLHVKWLWNENRLVQKSIINHPSKVIFCSTKCVCDEKDGEFHFFFGANKVHLANVYRLNYVSLVHCSIQYPIALILDTLKREKTFSMILSYSLFFFLAFFSLRFSLASTIGSNELYLNFFSLFALTHFWYYSDWSSPKNMRYVKKTHFKEGNFLCKFSMKSGKQYGKYENIIKSTQQFCEAIVFYGIAFFYLFIHVYFSATRICKKKESRQWQNKKEECKNADGRLCIYVCVYICNGLYFFFYREMSLFLFPFIKLVSVFI